MGNKRATLLNLFSDLLASGKTSRLYKRLVYDEQVATNVSSYMMMLKYPGNFILM